MWAPDVHKVKPFSAFSQLITAFVGLSIFAGGVYLIQASPPAVSTNHSPQERERESRGEETRADCFSYIIYLSFIFIIVVTKSLSLRRTSERIIRY